MMFWQVLTYIFKSFFILVSPYFFQKFGRGCQKVGVGEVNESLR